MLRNPSVTSVSSRSYMSLVRRASATGLSRRVTALTVDVPSVTRAEGGLRFFRAVPQPTSNPVTVTSSLSVKLEDDCFLVSHPATESKTRTVIYVVRCDSQGVVGYQLPDYRTRTPTTDLSVLCTLPTLMQAHFTAACGTFEVLDAKPIDGDIKSGKLLVVKHADPWAVMVACNQADAWSTLLQSLGGKYAALAALKDGKSDFMLQPDRLSDLL